MKAIGWNGAEFSVIESVRTLMQNIEVKHNCEVGFVSMGNCKMEQGRGTECERGREETRSNLSIVDSQIHIFVSVRATYHT